MSLMSTRGVAFALAVVWGGVAYGQSPLQITEIMSDTLSAGDDAWEWIELRNTGATPINLDGYVISRFGNASTAGVLINAVQTANTTIPAGGVAVLYDADVAIAEADFDDSHFRTAWQLSPTTPLIGVGPNFAGGLTNTGGTAIGIWESPAALNLDVVDDGMGVLRVAQFNNAAASLDFRTDSGFPAIGAGVSHTWNGSGSYQSGANWAATSSGTTSLPATIPGTTNSIMDVGNPGVLPSGTAPTGLWVTEIMFNPRSEDTDWEWVEVYNNTGATIDFGATPYVFDDDDDAAKSAANLTSGVIANGTAAVIYDGSQLSLSDLQAAWDPDGTRGTNFIGATNWTGGLTNGGDRFGIWPSLNAYQTEATTTGSNNRTLANAAAAIAYDDDMPTTFLEGVTGTWPVPDGNGSYSLTNLSLVSNQADTPTNGDSWVLSFAGDTLGSFNATGIPGTITIHPGGDLGTPGVFSTSTTGNANFDGVGGVDGNDFLIWQRGLGVGTTLGEGDADGDFDVDGADLAIWASQYGTPAVAAARTVPEPAALALAACGLVGVAVRRRVH